MIRGTTYVEYKFRITSNPYVTVSVPKINNGDAEYDSAVKEALEDIQSGKFFDETDLDLEETKEYFEPEKE